LRELFEQLCKAKYVRSEEYFGPKLRPLEHDTCCHTVDDIINHGPADSLWCYPNEGYIRVLINTPKNGKDYEQTLTKRALVALVVDWLTQQKRKTELRRAGCAPGDVLWEKAQKEFEGGLLFAASQTEAKVLVDRLNGAAQSEERATDERILISIRERGIAVSAPPSAWRKRSFQKLGPEQRQGVNRILAALDADVDASRKLDQNSVLPVRSVQYEEHNYTKGDFVIVQARGATEEFGRIERLYSASNNRGQRRVFVDMSFFRIKFSDGRPSGATLHNSLLLTSLKNMERDRVRLASTILRPFMPCPLSGETVTSSPTNHVIEVAPARFTFYAQDVWVPLYPKVR
jgi:hypothetical protein